MSEQGIVGKYADLRLHHDRERQNDLHLKIGRMDKMQLDGLYVPQRGVGGAVLLHSPGEPECVLEMFISPTFGDSVGSLFVAHPVFNSRDTYREARDELITLLEDFADAGPNGVAVFCKARGRAANIRELGLMQLLDMVRVCVARATGQAKPVH
jgi:hypothetical protein